MLQKDRKILAAQFIQSNRIVWFILLYSLVLTSHIVINDLFSLINIKLINNIVQQYLLPLPLVSVFYFANLTWSKRQIINEVKEDK